MRKEDEDFVFWLGFTVGVVISFVKEFWGLLILLAAVVWFLVRQG